MVLYFWSNQQLKCLISWFRYGPAVLTCSQIVVYSGWLKSKIVMGFIYQNKNLLVFHSLAFLDIVATMSWYFGNHPVVKTKSLINPMTLSILQTSWDKLLALVHKWSCWFILFYTLTLLFFVFFSVMFLFKKKKEQHEKNNDHHTQGFNKSLTLTRRKGQECLLTEKTVE